MILAPDGVNLNRSLVKNGYAWWYRQYAPTDTSLKQLEAEARAAKRGLWAEEKTAVAPWDWRKGTRPAAVVKAKVSRPVLAAPITNTVYITDTGSKYHEAGCRHLRRSQSAISLKDAEAQGYDACKHCH